MVNQKTIAIRHLDLSDNFLDLVNAVLSETIKTGNETFGIFDVDSDIQSEYKVLTRWSDNRIIIPVLFNFFHGLELFLKGAIYLFKSPEKKPNHNLTRLFETFKTKYGDRQKLADILNYYIYPNDRCEILYKFYIANNIENSSEFYELFRYPYNKKFEIGFNYKDLRDNENNGLLFFKQIIVDIQIIRDEKNLL